MYALRKKVKEQQFANRPAAKRGQTCQQLHEDDHCNDNGNPGNDKDTIGGNDPMNLEICALCKGEHSARYQSEPIHT